MRKTKKTKAEKANIKQKVQIGMKTIDIFVCELFLCFVEYQTLCNLINGNRK